MRLNLVSFLDPRVYAGGGEMITRRLIEVGAARGHDIRVAAVRPRGDDLHAKPDLVLFADVFNFGHTFRSLGAWRGFGRGFLDRAMRQAPFVHLTNAYVDVCNLPYLPCSGVCEGKCPVKPHIGPLTRLRLREWGNSCFAQNSLARELYARAALNVFLSPLHERVSTDLLGRATELPESFVLRPLIDTGRFTNLKEERDIDYLFVGVIGEAKGLAEMRERFYDADIVLIGRCAPGVELDFGRHLGHVPYDEVPKYMNRAKNFVFLPRWPEPQGRVVAEAALCGCTIIGNDNVGARSFDMNLANPESYVGAEDEFWTKLECIVQ